MFISHTVTARGLCLVNKTSSSFQNWCHIFVVIVMSTSPLNSICIVNDLDGFYIHPPSEQFPTFLVREMGWCDWTGTCHVSRHYGHTFPLHKLSHNDLRRVRYVPETRDGDVILSRREWKCSASETTSQRRWRLSRPTLHGELTPGGIQGRHPRKEPAGTLAHSQCEPREPRLPQVRRHDTLDVRGLSRASPDSLPSLLPARGMFSFRALVAWGIGPPKRYAVYEYGTRSETKTRLTFVFCLQQAIDVSVSSGYFYNRIGIFTLEALSGTAMEVSLGMSIISEGYYSMTHFRSILHLVV